MFRCMMFGKDRLCKTPANVTTYDYPTKHTIPTPKRDAHPLQLLDVAHPFTRAATETYITSHRVVTGIGAINHPLHVRK